MILSLVDEGLAQGARLEAICERLNISGRTIQRWRSPKSAEDLRAGPQTSPPANKLTKMERQRVLAIANSKEFRNLSPKQIVPRLADQGDYIASESSFYRVLRAEGQMAHRGRAKPPTPRPKPELLAIHPNSVWTWDITYLKSSIRGAFFYL